MEDNRFYRWLRVHLPDPAWPRVVELRLDAAGGVVAVAHIQRANTNGYFAPELGWELRMPARRARLESSNQSRIPASALRFHGFTNGVDATVVFDERLAVYHPTAPLKRRGEIEIVPAQASSWTYRYFRCRTADRVPMQWMAWQRVEIVLAPPSLARLTPSLSGPHRVEVEPALWSALYGELGALSSLPAPFPALLQDHRDAVVRSTAVGDDLGTVTGFHDNRAHAIGLGMNRLNHGAAIFEDGWRTLARRGYVCLAMDLVNWSDRGGGGYEEQQSLAANFLQLGASWAGLIAYEDMRTAEFLATRPEVDAKRIAALGLSLGGFRAWQVAALSDRIAAGVSVCWMATRKGLMVPKQNQTVGQSAFSMTHPGLALYLDYPDVAGVACPKPMMFLCGKRDPLFPVAIIEEAFVKMRKVWASQQATEALETRLYDAPHEFNLTMQSDAFAWLDKVLKDRRQ